MPACLAFALILLTYTDAYAYVGPALGISMLGYLLGFSGLVVLSIVCVLAWPVWRLIKWAQNRKSQTKKP